jgi:hypothetical protein
MWLVNPKLMCDKHLLGEHVEMHMFVGAIRKGISIQGYIDTGLVETERIKDRHDEIANEMSSRGMRHASPMDSLDITPAGKIDIVKNQIELCYRCRRCDAKACNSR